jgi:hypothetical protein
MLFSLQPAFQKIGGSALLTPNGFSKIGDGALLTATGFSKNRRECSSHSNRLFKKSAMVLFSQHPAFQKIGDNALLSPTGFSKNRR